MGKHTLGESADKLARLAVLEREERRGAALKETSAPPVMRLAMAVVGGVFLLMGQAVPLLVWVGAAALMISIAGATPAMGAACGAAAAAVAWFRMLGPTAGEAVFWLAMPLYVGGGALAGALGSVISVRLPPPAFPFLAALLPAGLEHLGSFGLLSDLSSTALTQFEVPFIVRIARVGGLAGITYVIYLVGGAAAVAVRYALQPTTALYSAVPALGLTLLAFIYGGASRASDEKTVYAVAWSGNSLAVDRRQLTSAVDYNVEAWEAHITAACDLARQYAEKQMAVRAIQTMRSAEDGAVSEGKTPEILVWPEALVFVNAETREFFFTKLKSIGQLTKCVQAAACYDVEFDESRVVMSGDGWQPVEGYARRTYVDKVDDRLLSGHLARAGTAPPAPFDTAAGRIGSILSLDANYFANFEALADAGAKVVCVNGCDDGVPQASLGLMVFNAARSGLPVLRAARDGELVAISADGVILSRQDSLANYSGTLEQALPLGKGGTIFLSIGNTFAWLALLAGLAAGLYASSKPAPPESGTRRRESGPITYRTRDGTKRV